MRGTMISPLKLHLSQRLPLPFHLLMKRHARMVSGAPLVLLLRLTRLCSLMAHPLLLMHSAALRLQDSTRLRQQP